MVRDVGIKDLKPPERECNDPYCPWHGKLSVRGRIFRGIVKKAKMDKTVVVEWERLYYLMKYERYERRKTKVFAHNPPCINAKEGDEVIIGECRPLSKAKHFVVLQVIKK